MTFRTALLALCALAPLALAHADPLQAALNTAVRSFRRQCRLQQALMPPLLTALRKKDLFASAAAYVAARPPYEQIETLAHVFPDLDADIDARPYVWGTGEDDPAFKGFHRIERDLYRDQSLDASYDTAVALNRSVNALCLVLADRSRFAPRDSFTGAIALALEVPAKKISSEEETWSDLSLMIFRNNYQGIWAQVEPYLGTGLVEPSVVRSANRAYERVQKVLNELDPDNDFFTTAGTARPYSTVPFLQRRRIIRAGYNLYDVIAVVKEQVIGADKDEEGEEEEEGSGPTLDADKYRAETSAGVAYFAGLCREQLRLLGPLDAAVSSDDLKGARRAYEEARPPYEQIETLAPSFLRLDREIDARPYALALGERDADWRGFHAVEREIFRERDLSGTRQSMRLLRASVAELCGTLERGDGEAFTAEKSWEGLLALAFEVPAKKIASEEETWSDLSVMIFRENVKGVQAVYEPFKARVSRRTARRVEQAFMRIKGLILFVIDVGNDWEGTKFRRYSTVQTWERKALSDSFYEYGRALQQAYAELL